MTNQEKWREVRKELLWFINIIGENDPIDFGTSCEEDFILDRVSVFTHKLDIMFPMLSTRWHNSILREKEVEEFIKENYINV